MPDRTPGQVNVWERTSDPQHVVVAGGGVGGVAAALAFSRAGHRVTIVERDVYPDISDPEAAFTADRRGAPQAHQTHGFLARVVVTLRERFPDVLDALLDVGCTTMPATANLGEPRPGDEDLAVLVVRRTTFEWVLRRSAFAEAGVEVHSGHAVSGLLTRPGPDPAGPPQVCGVVLDDGTTLEADAVIASTGRRGNVPAWLAPHGVDIPETVTESGLMYMSRWYRLPKGLDLGMDPKLGGDLGFVKYLAVPGDGDTFSVTLAIRSDDSEVRSALSDPDRFDEACRMLPGPNRFFASGPVEPLTGVLPMGGLLNRIRRFTDDDGTPLVLGFHAIGDAHTCTNPLYGRGCSLAMVQAVLLADAYTTHPTDAADRTVAYEKACRREVEPWYENALQMDSMGADPAGLSALTGGASAGGSGNEMAKGMGAIFVAAATDPIIGRAISRFMNLLSTPAELMANTEFLARVAEVYANPDAFPVPPREGPRRREVLAALAAFTGPDTIEAVA